LLKEIEKFEKYESGMPIEEKKDLKKLVDVALTKPLIRKELEEKGKVSTAIVRYEMGRIQLNIC